MLLSGIFCQFIAILQCYYGQHGHGQVTISVCDKEANSANFFTLFHFSLCKIPLKPLTPHSNEKIPYFCTLPF